jgi:hypothetical protein
MDGAVSGPDPEGMRSAWAADPERIDPDDYPARESFARLMTWAPCLACRLQAHTSYTRFLLQGIACPCCGKQLLAPPPDGAEQLSRAMRQEDLLSKQLESDAH